MNKNILRGLLVAVSSILCALALYGTVVFHRGTFVGVKKAKVHTSEVDKAVIKYDDKIVELLMSDRDMKYVKPNDHVYVDLTNKQATTSFGALRAFCIIIILYVYASLVGMSVML